MPWSVVGAATSNQGAMATDIGQQLFRGEIANGQSANAALAMAENGSSTNVGTGNGGGLSAKQQEMAQADPSPGEAPTLGGSAEDTNTAQMPLNNNISTGQAATAASIVPIKGVQ